MKLAITALGATTLALIAVPSYSQGGKKLNVKPQENPTSAALTNAALTERVLQALSQGSSKLPSP